MYRFPFFFICLFFGLNTMVNSSQIMTDLAIIPPGNGRIGFTLPSPLLQNLPGNRYFTNEELLKCDNNLNGSFDLESPSRFYLIPDKPLAPGLSFSCRLNEEKFPEFTRLKPARFATAPLELLYHRFDPETKRLKLVFNDQLMAEELGKKLILSEKLKSSLNNIRFRMEPDNKASDVFSLSFALPARDAELELNIDAGLNSIHDGKTLKPRKIVFSAKDILPSESIEKLPHGRKRVTMMLTDEPVEYRDENGNIGLMLYLPECLQNNNPAAFIRISPELPFQVGECQYNYRHEKPGQRYQIIISGDFAPQNNYNLQLLPGLYSWNLKLEEKYTADIQTTNRRPAALFDSQNRYVSPANEGIGLKVVNLEKIRVVIDRLLPQNYRYFLNFADSADFSFSRFSTVSHESIIEVKTPLNEMTTRILEAESLQKVAGNSSIFRIRLFDTVADKDGNIRKFAEKIVYLSDLGIMSRIFNDQLFVTVNSISNAKAVSGAQVRLYGENNALLAAGNTDAEGVLIRNIPELTAKAPALIVVSKSGDKNFLRLQNSVNSLPLPYKGSQNPNYEAFIFPERKLIRPGENISCAVFLRDRQDLQGASLPLQYQLFDPLQTKIHKGELQTDNAGTGSLKLEFPSFYKTGSYRLELLLGGRIIGRENLMVEDFIPPRLELQLQTAKEEFIYGDELPVNIQAAYLSGAPAALLPAELKISGRETDFQHPDFPDFTFSEYKLQEIQQIDLFQQTRNIQLDEQGKAFLNLPLPRLKRQGSLPIIEGQLGLTVFDDGRPLYKYQNFPVFPAKEIVGIRGPEKMVDPEQEIIFQTLLVSPFGSEKINRSLDLEIARQLWHFNYCDQTGVYRWEQEKAVIKRITVPANQSVTIPSPGAGRFIARLIDPLYGHAAAVAFQVSGWEYSHGSPNADGLLPVTIKLLSESLKPGETMELQINTPFPGRLLMTLENDILLNHHFLDFPASSGQISLPIPTGVKKGFHLHAYLLRPVIPGEKIMPFRSFGHIYVPLENSQNRLPLIIKAPDKTESNQKLSVTIQGEPGAIAYLSLIDVAILNMIEQNPPEPLKWFMRPIEYKYPLFDFYDYLDGPVKSAPLLRVGGDGGETSAKMKKHLNPEALNRNVKPFSYWYGPLHLNKKGQTDIELKLPDFNGRIRIAAVAATKGRIGSVFHELQIRDELRMEATVPAFMHTNDRLTIPLRISSNSDREIKSELNLSYSGSLDNVQMKKNHFQIKDGQAIIIPLDISAGKKAGAGEFTVSFTLDNRKIQSRNLIDVRQPASLQSYSQVLETKEAATVNIPSEYFAIEDPELELSISNSRLSLLQGAFQKLISYPHGCAEQLSSKLFALLHAGKFIDPSRKKGQKILEMRDIYIKDGIQKLLGLQTLNGDFMLWPEGETRNDFVSLYVSDFLLEAAREGFSEAGVSRQRIISWLKKFPQPQLTEKNSLLPALYATYLLSLEKELSGSRLNYLIDSFEPDENPLHIALTGAVLSLHNQKQALPKILQKLDKALINHRSSPENRRWFGSEFRDQAFVTMLSARHFAPERAEIIIDKMTEKLIKSQSLYSTQEQAFGLRAVSAWYGLNRPEPDFKLQLQINGREMIYDQAQKLHFTLKNPQIILQPLQGLPRISMEITAPLMPESGQKTKNPNSILNLRKTFLDVNKKPVEAELSQGELIYSGIELTARETINQAAIIERIPACFEIVNMRLNRQQKDSQNLYPQMDYIDIRDDRILLFGRIPRGKTVFMLPLRAVFTGECTVPVTMAEDMYDTRINDRDRPWEKFRVKSAEN